MIEGYIILFLVPHQRHYISLRCLSARVISSCRFAYLQPVELYLRYRGTALRHMVISLCYNFKWIYDKQKLLMKEVSR